MPTKLQAPSNGKFLAVIERRQQRVLLRLRVIAALLFASIAWSSTVEFTHNHGARGSKANSATGSLVALQNHPLWGEQVQPNEPLTPSSRSNSKSECLTCQLHQNFATTLLTERAGVTADEASTSYSQPTASVHFSESTATQHGRAPPLNL